MRVVLSQFEGIDNTPALPLAAGTLIASAKLDPEVRSAARFAIEVERRSIDRVDAYVGADVLGFSLYPWNAVYSLAVARAARRACPHSLIVAGGPSVPRRPASAARLLDKHPELDVLVFSERELAFRELLRRRLRGDDLETIGGIAFRRTPGSRDYRFTEPPGRIADLGGTASPYLDGTFDELLAAGRDRFAMALVETNRGCPFACTFCDWSLTTQVAEFPMERVRAELEWIVSRGLTHIALTDANFGIRPRDEQIARHLAWLKRETGRPNYCYFYLTKNNHRRNLKTIEILHGAGIGCCVGLAVQDFDDDVLEAVKRDNIQTAETMRLREICGGRGIPTHNELILGLPRQTYDSFTRTVAAAMPSYPRHSFVIFLCRLLDNSEMAEPSTRQRYGIETRLCPWKTARAGWDPVIDEVQELVVGTADMPVADWRRTFRFAFFASAAYNLRLLRAPLHYVPEMLGVGLRDYLECLCERTVDADPGSVFAAMGAVFDRYITSILGGGAFALPIPDGGGAAVEIADAVAIVALRDPGALLREAEAHTLRFLAERGADAGALDELFRYQRLITPRFGDEAVREAEFAFDWLGYTAAGGTGAKPAVRPTTLRFHPPSYAGVPDYHLFATTYIACMRAHLGTGEVELAGGSHGFDDERRLVTLAC